MRLMMMQQAWCCTVQSGVCYKTASIHFKRPLKHFFALPQVDDRQEMVVVTSAEAQRLIDTDGFLVHQTVMGHTYGITRSSLARAQATGLVSVSCVH